MDYDGSKLFLADPNNHRVIIFDAVPTSSFQTADLVLGQKDFSVNVQNFQGPSSSSLSSPRAVHSDGTSLYVCDTLNHRVLIWDTIPTTNNQPADHVLGQMNFTANLANRGGSIAANTLNTPEGVYSGASRLFVSDTFNNRTLVWDLPIDFSSGEGPNADHVLGQADLVSGLRNRDGMTSSVNDNTLYNPRGLFSDGSVLYCADSRNNRVLQWDHPISFPMEGPAAQRVIGQSLMTNNGANMGGRSKATMNRPYGVFADSAGVMGHTYVADRINHRALIWETSAPATGAAADTVLGQPDGVSTGANNPSLADTSLSNPTDVASTGSVMLVYDQANNRVKIHDPIPTAPADNDPATIVYGQRTFSESLANHGAIDARSMRTPGGVATDGNKLFVADRDNNRVLAWNTIPNVNNKNADIVFGQSDFASPGVGTSDVTLRSPTDTAFDPTANGGDGRLFVADRLNNRVVVYDGPFSVGMMASQIIGQMLDTDFGSGTAQNRFNDPSGVSWDGSALWVADRDNNRILKFTTLTTNANADIVIGQALFTDGGVNHSGLGDPDGDQSLHFPEDVVSTGSELLVADRENHRVMIWDPLPVVDDESAAVVLGQSTFLSGGAPGTDRSSLRLPMGVESNGTCIYVMDGNNNRIMIWDSIPVSNGVAADRLIGQPDFTSNLPNSGGVTKGSLFIGTTVNSSPALVGTTLWAPDQRNNRVLRYDVTP